MKLKKTWKNLAIAMFVLPVRVPAVVLCRAITKLGEYAKWLDGRLCAMLPGLEIDYTAEEIARKKVDVDAGQQ